MRHHFKFTVQHSWAIPFLLTTGILINLFVYSRFGIKVVNDSVRYFEYRDLILGNGFFIDRHNIWYVGYVSFLVLCKSIGLGDGGVIILQSLISIIAGISIYFTAKNLAESNFAGLIAALVFFLWVDLSQWNMYILCESLFTSFTAVTCYLILKEDRTWKIEIATISLLLFTSIIKPAGISLLGAGLIFYIFRIFLQPKTRAIAVGALIITISALCNTMMHTFRLVETYATGDIIYGCSLNPGQPCPALFTLERTSLTIPEKSQPIIEVVGFFLLNPWFSLKLAASKLLAFVLHMKPYYSIWHNLFIAFTLFPVYYFLWIGFRSVRESRFAFMVTFLSASCIVVMMTIEDWDGRFLMPLLPLIFTIAGTGIYIRLFKTKQWLMN